MIASCAWYTAPVSFFVLQEGNLTALTGLRLSRLKAIATALTMSLALTPALGQKPNPPKASVPRFFLALQLLTDTGDLDATPYMDDLQKSVKDKALATLPKPVSHGDQGIVIIRFEIQKDGNLARNAPPKFIFPSGKKELDDHAMSAISAAAPFNLLPEPLSGRTLSVQLTFYYNLAPPQPQ